MRPNIREDMTGPNTDTGMKPVRSRCAGRYTGRCAGLHQNQQSGRIPRKDWGLARSKPCQTNSKNSEIIYPYTRDLYDYKTQKKWLDSYLRPNTLAYGRASMVFFPPRPFLLLSFATTTKSTNLGILSGVFGSLRAQ